MIDSNIKINTSVKESEIDTFVQEEQHSLQEMLSANGREDIWFSDLETCIWRTINWLQDKK